MLIESALVHKEGLAREKLHSNGVCVCVCVCVPPLTSSGLCVRTAFIARLGEKHVDTATCPSDPSMWTTETEK